MVDPDEALIRIRELLQAEWVRRNYRNGTLTPWEVRELVDHVAALDDWLSKGGYQPAPWANNQSTLENLGTGNANELTSQWTDSRSGDQG